MARSICMVDGCDKFVHASGLCNTHRKRMVLKGTLEELRPKDWGKREKHPLYNTWRSKLRYDTRDGICDRWRESFWNFVEDVKEKPEGDYQLRRIDETKVLGPDNYHWVEVFKISRLSEKGKEYLKSWAKLDRKANPEKYRDKKLRKTYGITLEDYENMEENQGYVCAICGKPESAVNPRTRETRNLAVDHCHETGTVRALLCANCNKGIGSLGDDPNLLQKAAEYLKKYQGQGN